MMDTNLPVLLIAHGQPSDAAPAGRALDRLAEQVGNAAGGRAVAAATLAETGAVAAGLARLGPSGLVFPMFMAGGWFTRVAIPDHLRQAGARVGPNGWQVLDPFGCLPSVHDLARDILADALTGQDLSRAEVLVAAHGSFKSRTPSDVAMALVRHLQQGLGLGRCAAGFIDQAPRLDRATGFGAGSICLPFFAAEGGHVTHDLPRALAEARFGGRVLPPLGLHPRVPALIAEALTSPQPVCAQTCRYSLGATA